MLLKWMKQIFDLILRHFYQFWCYFIFGFGYHFGITGFTFKAILWFL